MNDVNDTSRAALERGHYYQKQLGCDSGVIAWSHRFSPLGFSRGLASSQAWFVCRPIPSSGSGR